MGALARSAICTNDPHRSCGAGSANCFQDSVHAYIRLRQAGPTLLMGFRASFLDAPRGVPNTKRRPHDLKMLLPTRILNTFRRPQSNNFPMRPDSVFGPQFNRAIVESNKKFRATACPDGALGALA